MSTHISHSELLDLNELAVQARPPSTDKDGNQHPAKVEAWLLGNTDPFQMRHYWSFDVEDAEQLGHALLDAAAEARKLM